MFYSPGIIQIKCLSSAPVLIQVFDYITRRVKEGRRTMLFKQKSIADQGDIPGRILHVVGIFCAEAKEIDRKDNDSGKRMIRIECFLQKFQPLLRIIWIQVQLSIRVKPIFPSCAPSMDVRIFLWVSVSSSYVCTEDGCEIQSIVFCQASNSIQMEKH